MFIKFSNQGWMETVQEAYFWFWYERSHRLLCTPEDCVLLEVASSVRFSDLSTTGRVSVDLTNWSRKMDLNCARWHAFTIWSNPQRDAEPKRISGVNHGGNLCLAACRRGICAVSPQLISSQMKPAQCGWRECTDLLTEPAWSLIYRFLPGEVLYPNISGMEVGRWHICSQASMLVQKKLADGALETETSSDVPGL